VFGPPLDNLQQVRKPCVNSKNNMFFKFSVDKSEGFVRFVEHDMKDLRNSLDISPLMDIYYKKVRHALLVRGIISIHLFKDLKMLLRYMRPCYYELIPRWQIREFVIY
jgi:hypothetical protein